MANVPIKESSIQSGASMQQQTDTRNANEQKDDYEPVSVSFLVPLPRIEIVFYFIIWISHSLYSFYTVWLASYTYRGQLPSYFFEPGQLLLGGRERDISNIEWFAWAKETTKGLPWFIGHAILFNLTETALGKLWKPMMLLYWIVAHFSVYGGLFAIAITFLHGIIMFGLIYVRVKILIWLAAISLIAIVAQEWVYGRNVTYVQVYLYMVFFAYKLIQYISYCLHAIDHPELRHQKPWYERFYDMYWYAFYMPYNVSLIVLYKDFTLKLDGRKSEARDHRGIAMHAARLCFWIVFNEVIIHFIYFNALVVSPRVLGQIAKTDLALLASVGYTAGQFFQTKYIGVFGFPALFARLDRMSNETRFPICISRVALYSKMWRRFDIGLYRFLKELIYKPVLSICPHLFVWRGFSMALCFLFVFIWHGATKYYFVWICMNFVEVLLENVGRELWHLERTKILLNAYFSKQWSRRLVGGLHVPCVSLGILAIFFFIGGYESGCFFVREHYIEGIRHMKFSFWYLMFLGYCFSQCCIEFDRREAMAAENKRGNTRGGMKTD